VVGDGLVEVSEGAFPGCRPRKPAQSLCDSEHMCVHRKEVSAETEQHHTACSLGPDALEGSQGLHGISVGEGAQEFEAQVGMDVLMDVVEEGMDSGSLGGSQAGTGELKGVGDEGDGGEPDGVVVALAEAAVEGQLGADRVSPGGVLAEDGPHQAVQHQLHLPTLPR